MKRAAGVGVIASAFGALVWLRVPLCPSAFLFGISCPGCGMTRAALATLQGDFAGALHFHPLAWFVVPAVALFLVDGVWNYVRGVESRLLLTRAATLVFTALFVLLIVVWVARMLGAFGGPAPIDQTIWSHAH